MTQYPDGNGNPPAFTGPVLGGTWVDDGAAAPSNASQSDISNGANNGASHCHRPGAVQWLGRVRR